MEAREKSEIVFKQKNVRNNKKKKTIMTEWKSEKTEMEEKRDP